MKKLSDKELMTHLRDGDGDALAILYERYHRLVLSVGLRILRDWGEAEDVMQAVFLEVYRAAAQFDATKGTAKVWLLQYAYHRSLNRRQQLKTRVFYENSTILEAQAETPSRCGSSRALELPEVRRLISEALSTLNKAQRQTLCLAYFEGLTLREISQQNGESLDNVRHHYYRGLDRLRSYVLNTKAAQKVGLGEVRDLAWSTDTLNNCAR